MAKAPSIRPRVDTARCPQCRDLTYRVPRLPAHKVLIGSKRFRCDGCNLIFLKWLGLTLGGARGRGAGRVPMKAEAGVSEARVEAVPLASVVEAVPSPPDAPKGNAGSTAQIKTFKWPAFRWPKVTWPTYRFPRTSLPKVSLPKISLPKVQIPKPDISRWKNQIRWPDFGRLKIQVNWAGMIRFKTPTLSRDARAWMRSLGGYGTTIVLGIAAAIGALYLLWFVLLPYLLSGDRSIRF